jgi:hypothetical protein
MRLAPAFERLLILLSQHKLVDGLWVGIVVGKSELHLLDRVEAALHFIERYDPARYRRLHRDVGRIWIFDIPGARGNAGLRDRVCKLDRSFVANASPEMIASTIVHETAHLHPCLRKFGYPEEKRRRIERICFLQQIAFANRSPGGEIIREGVEQNLGRPSEFWTADSMYAWRVQKGKEALLELGVLKWLVSVVTYWADRNIRIGRKRAGRQ